MKRYSKTPEAVSKSSLGTKSNIYRVTVDGVFDVKDIFITSSTKRASPHKVVILHYDASLNQRTGKTDLIPYRVETLFRSNSKQTAINWQREWLRKKALTYKRLN